MSLGKHTRFCPNCAEALYDSNISMTHVKSLCCSDICRNEWDLKRARSILGKDESDCEEWEDQSVKIGAKK